MKPSVGRIVFYFEGEYQDLRPTAGIITAVHELVPPIPQHEEDGYDVEIMLFPPGGMRVPHRTPIPWTPSDQPKLYCWCWPPRVT
jgi:hypothetical protein